MLKKKNIVYIYGGKYIISILSSDVCPVYVLENFGLFIYLFFFWQTNLMFLITLDRKILNVLKKMPIYFHQISPIIY